jgi:hypothetical protein
LAGAVPNFLNTGIAIIHLMLAFTVLAVLLFGSDVGSFSSIGSAFQSLFFMLIGRASTSKELAHYSDESGSPIAVLYLFIFTVVLVFVTSASVISTITEAWSDSTELLMRDKQRKNELKKLEMIQKQSKEYDALEQQLEDVSAEDIEMLAEIMQVEARAASRGGPTEDGSKVPIAKRTLGITLGEVKRRRLRDKEAKADDESGVITSILNYLSTGTTREASNLDATAVFAALNMSSAQSYGAVGADSADVDSITKEINEMSRTESRGKTPAPSRRPMRRSEAGFFSIDRIGSLATDVLAGTRTATHTLGEEAGHLVDTAKELVHDGMTRETSSPTAELSAVSAAAARQAANIQAEAEKHIASHRTQSTPHGSSSHGSSGAGTGAVESCLHVTHHESGSEGTQASRSAKGRSNPRGGSPPRCYER